MHDKRFRWRFEKGFKEYYIVPDTDLAFDRKDAADSMDEPGIADEWHVTEWVWTLVNDFFHRQRLCDILKEMRWVYQPIGFSDNEIVAAVTRMIVNRQLLLYRAEPSFAAASAVLDRLEEMEQAESAAAVRSTTFIEIALTDDDDRPIGGHAFELVLPDGRTVWPETSRNGTVRIDSVPEGSCDCIISELDNDFWRRTT